MLRDRQLPDSNPIPSILRMRSVVLTLVGIAALIVVVILTTHHSTRIAYVRTAELINGYQATAEARSALEIKGRQWKGEIDSLQAAYRQSLDQFNQSAVHLPQQERGQQSEFLRHQEEGLVRYTHNVQTMASDEQETRMRGILNQINTYIEEYGKEQGYDLILGTTSSGSLLYARDEIDITEEVLRGLNRQYKGSADKQD